jgi:lysozyme family protein
MELTGKLKKEYLDLWNSCVIKSRFEDDLDSEVEIIEANQSRYIKVAKETGVPWYVIAIIHGMEASFDFSTHLHNGDSLNDRTVQFPAGRPRQGNPPFTWEKSAIDALNFDGATEIKSWNLPTIFWFLEGYNGWGYRTEEGPATTPTNRSPYIYSGTTHYEQGKYRADGIFDPCLVSAKVGCMAQLFGLVSKGLVNLDSSILQPANTDPMKVGSSSDPMAYQLPIGLKHLIFVKIFFRSPLHLTFRTSNWPIFKLYRSYKLYLLKNLSKSI